MLKTLLCCVILGGLPFSALAGERSGVPVAPIVPAGLIKDPATSRAPVPASNTVLPSTFTLPAGGARLESLPQAPAPGENQPVKATVAVQWGPGSTLPDVTARAGGSYAVHDILRALPRPRHRQSPLSAAFVLRLDGNDDSPAFSVEGGGVAEAVWQVVPK